MTGLTAASPWRSRSATLLISLAAVLLCAAAVTQYAGNALLDSGHVAERSASALKEPAVRQFVEGKANGPLTVESHVSEGK